MAEPVRVRRLTDQEGQRLQQMVRSGTGSAVCLRRAMVILALAGGNTVPASARLINPDDEAFIVTTASTRPEKLDQPFTRWSIRKLADYLAHNRGGRGVRIGRERLRQILRKHGISFQRTKTWKASTDPDRDVKLARIEHVASHFPDRVFAFDEFGPLTIRPHAGASWAPKNHPDRLPANYHQLHGVRQFHGCYSVGIDTMWGVVRQHKSAANTLAALKSVRAARPDGAHRRCAASARQDRLASSGDG